MVCPRVPGSSGSNSSDTNFQRPALNPTPVGREAEAATFRKPEHDLADLVGDGETWGDSDDESEDSGGDGEGSDSDTDMEVRWLACGLRLPRRVNTHPH